MVTAPGAAPRLRHGLRFERRASGGVAGFIIEDPVRGRFYRVGLAEQAFLAALDGDVAAALAQANAQHPEMTLDVDDARAILAWLAREGLLEGSLAASAQHAAATRLPRWLNPLVMRLPLVDPDGWLSRHQQRLGLLYGKPALVVWSLVVGSAVLAALFNGAQLAHASGGIFYRGNWLGLLAVWVVAKLAHEVSHGLVCKRFGGHVHEAGLLFVLFLPIGYVDATSSWRFSRKRERAFVALAGMYAELFLAALALWGWLWLAPGIARELALNMVVVAGVTTLLFNANPLMRFDGYYALSDLLDIPNLYAAGQREVARLWHRHVLGLPSATRGGGDRRTRFVRTYGLAALVWRTLVIVMLLVAAAHLLHGLGVFLAGLAGAGLVLGWTRRATALWQVLSPPLRWRASLRVLALAALVTGLLATVSWRARLVVPAVVEHAGLEAVRLESAGFLRALHVQAGEAVVAGQLLAELDNPDLALAAALRAIECEQAALRERSLRSRGELGAARRAAVERARLEGEHAALRAELAALTLRAPRDGIVDGSDLPSLVGRHFAQGDELLAVVAPAAKRVRASLPQAAARGLVPQQATLSLPGRARIALAMHELGPRASRRVGDDLTLAATHGGPLSVRGRPATPGQREGLEFLDARLHWEGALPAVVATRIRAGETGSVVLRGAAGSALGALWHGARAWLEHLTQRARTG
ncbi:MAG: HlyD family efflux transporter periplasmic adaptor subunit [Gammaproteobacteria bacterium]